jgi:hypothetical protein
MGRSGSSDDHVGQAPVPGEPPERRRRAGDTAFAVVAFAVVAFAVVAFAVVAFAVVAFAGVVDVDRVAFRGAVDLVAAGAGLAVGAGVAAGAGVVAGCRVDAARDTRGRAGFFAAAEADLDADARPARSWRFRIAWRSADSSSISSRTSANRAARRSRLRLVAFSSRPARQVSSDRAAASANSSHSTWRVRASDGDIAVAARRAPAGPAPPVDVRVAAGAAA